MRRWLAAPARLVRRRGRPLLVCLLLGVAAALAAPHLWAWQQLRAGRHAVAHYRTPEARARLAACLRVWPDSAEAHFLATRAARRAEAFDEAEHHLRRYEALRPDHRQDAVLEWALLRAAMGDLKPVEDFLLDQALGEPALAPSVWEALAQGYVRMYRILDAVACLDRWLQVQPDNVQALFLRGEARRQVKQVQLAVPDYRRVVELDPGRDEARRWLGVCLLEIGRYEEARQHFDHLRQRDPDDAELLVLVARCLDKLGQAAAATGLLDAALAAHPGYGPALRERGLMAQRAGRLAEAEGWLRQALQAAPYDYQVSWSLYQCLEGQDRSAEARAQMAQAQLLKDRRERLGEVSTRLIPVRPHDPALHCEMGTLLLSLGHPDLGQRWLLTALSHDPDYAPAHAALADYYEARGDREQAAHHRRQARATATGAAPSRPEQTVP